MPANAAETLLNSVDTSTMLDLAQDMVRIPSFKTEESDLAHFLAEFLEPRGYQVELQEVDPGRFQTIATLKGSGGGKSLMLNGHIDMTPSQWAGIETPGLPPLKATAYSAAASAT